jgi:adenylate cyclase
VRIAVRLSNAETGVGLWADGFEGSLDDVFELQDKVASSVAGVIEPALQAAETARSAGRPTNDMTAYDLYQRAYAMVLSSARQIPEALRLMEQAIARDPRYGPALAWAAYCCVRLALDGRSTDPEADRLRGADFARRALEEASDDASILANAAFALASFGENIGAMMMLLDRALELNPSFARGWYLSGVVRIWAGQPDVAIEHIDTALRLSPRVRVGWALVTIGVAHLSAQRFHDAVPNLLGAIQDDHNHTGAYRVLAVCYAHMGQLDDARAIITRLRAITPDVDVIPDLRGVPNTKLRDLLVSGLHLAMGEVG